VDKIFLNDIKVNALIGTLPHERVRRQQILIDITMNLDLGKAGISDDLADTVNYSEIEERAVKIASESKFYLLEALVQAIGVMVMSYPQLVSAVVRITKERAPRFARSVAVEREFFAAEHE
jgi:FolB domain-containing protein